MATNFAKGFMYKLKAVYPSRVLVLREIWFLHGYPCVFSCVSCTGTRAMQNMAPARVAWVPVWFQYGRPTRVYLFWVPAR